MDFLAIRTIFTSLWNMQLKDQSSQNLRERVDSSNIRFNQLPKEFVMD